MKHPSISVLMPVYNGEAYLKEAIDSVLHQSFTDFELLIVNDGSTDRTEEIIRSYTDPRIVLLNQTNGGVSSALNTGLKQAAAFYIVRMDADDICHPDRLQLQWEFVQAHPDYVLAGTEADYIDMNGHFIFLKKADAYEDGPIRKLPITICPFIHATVIYKKEAVLKAGGYSEHAHSFEDHLLWTILSDYGKIANMPLPLLKVRFNPSSLTIDEKWRGKRFNELKYRAIARRFITREEGDELLAIIRSQQVDSIQQGAYYSLLAKKYLWNNYQPSKARKNASLIIKHSPSRPEGYMLWLASLLPERLIRAVYRVFK